MKSDLTLHRVIGRGGAVDPDAPDYSDVPYYTRPADWLTVPAPAEGEQKINLLIAVFPTGYNSVAFEVNFSGGFTIDWGDGTIDNPTNPVAEHTYNYSSISASTECSRGYRQVIATITKSDGNLNYINFARRPSNISSSMYFIPPILSIKMRGQYFTSTGFSVYNSSYGWLAYCEEFEFYGLSFISSLSYRGMWALQKVVFEGTNVSNVGELFKECYSLVRAPEIYWGNVTSGTEIFRGCYSLRYIPSTYDFSMLTSLYYTFNSCYSLKYLPDIDARKVTTFYGAFQDCRSLTKIKFIGNTDKVTNMSNAFQDCAALEEITGLTMPLVQSATYMFSGCQSLAKLPATSAPVLNNVTYMFQQCRAIKKIPITLTTTLCTQFHGTFNGCSTLIEAPNMDTSNGTAFWQTFQDCMNLKSIPAYNTSKVTSFYSAFYNCYSLPEMPQLDYSKSTDFGMIFYRCQNLRKIEITFGTGVTVTGLSSFLSSMNSAREISLFNIPSALAIGTNMGARACAKLRLQGCAKSVTISPMLLDRDALVQVFQDLASGVTGQTITITTNPGAASLSAADRQIATDKGWTIVG